MRQISVATVNKHRGSWILTMSLAAAKKISKDWNHAIFQIPNGSYVIRRPTGKRMTPELRKALEKAGQNSWR